MGGTPQFFGGSADGEGAPLETLQREVGEESRGTLRLNTISGEVFTALPANEDRNTYNFFYSIDWQRTQTQWNDNVTNPAEREMQRLVEVPRGHFDPQQDNDDDIRDILLLETGTTQARGVDQFRTSHTKNAFVIFIRDIWPHL
ncbi:MULTISPECIES: hypothetical protein [unclassified Microcoleus]